MIDIMLRQGRGEEMRFVVLLILYLICSCGFLIGLASPWWEMAVGFAVATAISLWFLLDVHEREAKK